MYYGLDSNTVRYLMRKTRKEQNLRQEDVSDDEMSYGTISNIERGVINVKEKLIQKYLEKLGLTAPRLKRLVKKEQKRIDELNFRLEIIESMLDNNKTEKAEQLLKEIKLEAFHPLAPYYAYLEGRCWQAEKDWRRAEKHYKLAIRLFNQYNLTVRKNISAICFNELSICCYNQNNLEKALHYVEKGIEKCNDKFDNYSKYPLLSNKILYLIHNMQYDAANQALEEVWGDLERIENIHIKLNLHKFRAQILRKMGKYQEALTVCSRGIDIAKQNRIQSYYLDLITVTGSIYLLKKQFEEAKLRFSAVLTYDYKTEFPRSHIDSLTYLAIIYEHEKEYEKAKEHIKKAVELARKIPQVSRLAKALIVAGNIYLEQDIELAVRYYQEAEKVSENKQQQYTALLQLTYCFDKMNEKDRWNSYIKKLVNVQRDINLRSGEIYAI